MTNRRGVAMLLGLGALVLGGCVEPELEELERKLDEFRASPGQVELAPLPVVPDYNPIAYDQADRRSPFRSSLPAPEQVPEGSADLAPDLDRPREPLEAYPLEQLELVGTLNVANRPSALVRAPGGEVHRLTSGDRLGTDYGRIIGITARSVQMVEVVNNGRGGWVERTRQLTLDDETTKQAG
ncbi:pilus assembly protein PilP [Halomonas sp. YLGW01]|uniref:pilus assembly protein PilP n=1 Tax=Halomonas sp. YLGW01 TaxID=2773308 RepID=UPI001F5BB31F|nr:pilus assembly protein PilP [Halomonas sp. YLGW01]